MTKAPAYLTLIKHLEKDLGVTMGQCPFDEIEGIKENGFSLDEVGTTVNGLSLYRVQVAPAVETLAKFPDLKKLSIVEGGINNCAFVQNYPLLTHLNLTGNNIEDISCLEKLKNLANVYLGNNRVSDITPLGGLKRLSGLDVQHNQITGISVLKGLKRLAYLDLNRNKITDISPLKDLKLLTYLTADDNQIGDISCLRQLDRLTYASLRNNKIDDISCLRELSRLTYLNLAENSIKDISILQTLRDLTYLNLRYNSITDFSALKNLQQLKKLYLESNKISDISFLGDLCHLQELNLGFNKITNISSLQGMTDLFFLDLQYNQLADISVLQSLTQLKTLFLQNNQLTDISVLKELTNLTKLHIYDNQLSDISALKELTNLTELYLYKNQISVISPLKELQNLKSLSIGENQISDISVLKELTNLNHLILDDNQISNISPLKRLTNLTYLNLNHNKLSRLPREILDLDMEILWEYGDYWHGIVLEGNPLEHPPVEIVKKGKEAIKAWFASMEGEKKPLNEVKVLLVGDGGAGKTSLVKQLLGKAFDKNETQTHGINIDHWEVKPRTNGDKIKVNIWDFGGQEIMHAAHQFFLSKRSLYVLVLDGRKDEKVEYWLKHVNSFGGDSPVLVVINKIDQNPGFDVNRNFLQQKYPNIRGFFRLSCAIGNGIQSFSQQLVKELATVELIHTTWPRTWFSVKTYLENMKEDFINYHQYKTICQKENIDDKTSWDTLVDFLNDLGVVLYFKDFKLKETHVLEPEWVTTAVYKIINSKDAADAKGLLQLSRLDDVLKRESPDDYYYPPDKYRFIVELMQKFQLCYEIGPETVLIPDLLEVQEPSFEFDTAAALKFLVAYDFLPRSIMPRFIVKMHKDIKAGLQWRTGVVLEDKAFGCTAVVIADNEEKKIHIHVQGSETQRRDYFSILRKALRDINNSFEKLDAVEKVPMPDAPHVTVSYNHLLLLEEKGIADYIPDGSTAAYKVKDLLGTVHLRVENAREEEILNILRKLKEKYDTEETLLQKANDVFEIKPSLLGIGININNLIKKLFNK
jgi:small GTP-binding protein